jgi:hypothetical protein
MLYAQCEMRNVNCELTNCSFPIDRDDLSCGKVVGEWSFLAPLGAPRPHQPSALGLVGAFLFGLLGARIRSCSLQTRNNVADRIFPP